MRTNTDTFEQILSKLKCKFADSVYISYLKEQYAAKLGFKDGAKWQAERMYNKEDTIDFAHFYFNVEFNSTMQDCKTSEEIWDLWVQQRKKK